jgi:hypothetical protein
MRRVDRERSIFGDRARGAKIGPSEEGGRVSGSGRRKCEQRGALEAPWALGALEPRKRLKRPDALVWEKVPKTAPQGRHFLPPFHKY